MKSPLGMGSQSIFCNNFIRRPRGEKRPIPEEQKDEKYFERRKRNNEAAKKSRDARKMREDRVRLGVVEKLSGIYFLSLDSKFLFEFKSFLQDNSLKSFSKKLAFNGNLKKISNAMENHIFFLMNMQFDIFFTHAFFLFVGNFFLNIQQFKIFLPFLQIALRAAILEQENSILRAQTIALREEVCTLRQILCNSRTLTSAAIASSSQ